MPCWASRHKEPRLPVFRSLYLSLSLMLFFAPHIIRAQEPEAEPEATSTPTRSSEVPDVPGLSGALHGLNAGLTVAGTHDSLTGWATLATPAISYSFNDTFSIDASIPIYMYRLAPSQAAHPRANALLVKRRAELADVVIGLHAQCLPRLFNYQASFAVTAPTGNQEYGLSTGRVTFDLTNRFERPYRRFNPNIEIGAGDSTTLVNRLVNKNYTTLGPLAHFQAGIGLPLPRNVSFEADAYEQLPIGDQKIYGAQRKNRPPLVIGHNAAEDNGFTTALDIPVDAHTTLSGYYSRSLRLRVDSVSIAITYVLRGARAREAASIDDLLR